MNDIPDLGHNLPPLTDQELSDRLALEFEDLINRRDELMAAYARAPTVIDDDNAGDVGDFIKQLTAAAKTAESHRVARKEPYLRAGRVVDGFFKGVSEPIGIAKARIESTLTRFLRAKAERERLARLEAEREAQEEARRKAQEAREADAAIHSLESLDAALAATQRAQDAQADATAAGEAARAKAAELSRTRGAMGAVASLATHWTFDNLDRDRLNLEALRQHIPTDALEKAVRSYIRAGGRELPGVNIFETTGAVVR